LYGSFIATSVYGFILTRSSWRAITKSELPAWKSLWNYGKYTQAGNVLHMSNQRGYLFALEKLSPEGNLMAGIFSVLLYIGEGIWSVAKSLSAIQGAEIAQDEEHAQHREITRRYLKVSLVASFMGIVFFLLLPSRWLAVFLDNKSEQVTDAFFYFIPGIVLHTITIILAHYFSGKGYHRYNALSSFFGLFTSVVIAGIFIPRMGINGAALSISISIAVQCLVQFVLYRRVVKALGVNPN
jgi:O-antigen/teichoic acid export membrane protein